MSAVTRLVTFVEVDGERRETISVSARLELELTSGARVVLLNDRGWSGSGGWTSTSATCVRETARAVVGPDEPLDGVSYEHEAAAHWDSLEQIARDRGVAADATELRRLPHDVVLSAEVLARIAPDD
ncbi:hypothetical protein GCM10009854_14940 [Saccharopolyspora halophila]|uniref:Uncharacterized protein n=1 Tax=Saccharopolyspora halophila TaxID=405551 RepID=A0ABN3FYH2_9PSEU